MFDLSNCKDDHIRLNIKLLNQLPFGILESIAKITVMGKRYFLIKQLTLSLLYRINDGHYRQDVLFENPAYFWYVVRICKYDQYHHNMVLHTKFYNTLLLKYCKQLLIWSKLAKCKILKLTYFWYVVSNREDDRYRQEILLDGEVL